MLPIGTQPMPILLASMPHSCVSAMQQVRNVMPPSAAVGQFGAAGGGGRQVAPLTVPQVEVA